MKRGSIELARKLCVQIAGDISMEGDGDGGDYGSVDVAEILSAEVVRLRKDEKRLDWLADPDNHIGNVQLPTHCVMQNLHSLRDAIDAAMKEFL